MPTTTPRKPRQTAKNQPQPFRQTLNPAMPLMPTIDAPKVSRRGAAIGLGIIALALSAGILGGLALRNLAGDTITVTPGSVAVVTNPQYARILQAKAVAATANQTLQLSQNATSVQPVNTDLSLQGSYDLSRLQPDLSAYDAQGSVGGPAR